MVSDLLQEVLVVPKKVAGKMSRGSTWGEEEMRFLIDGLMT